MKESAAERSHKETEARTGSKFSLFRYTEEERHEIRYRIRQILELVIVIFFTILASSLFSLPVIFYHLETQEVSGEDPSLNEMSTLNTLLEDTKNETDIFGDMECLNPYQYDESDRTCHSELLDALSESDCAHEYGQAISVVRNGQELANQIFAGLEFIRATEYCLVEATSFLCLYAYGLCSSSGVYIQPTSSQCEELRDSLCQTEWETTIRFGIALPNCNDLPTSPVSCLNFEESNSSTPINMTGADEINKSNATSAVPFECSDGFYRENGSQICTPSCYSWHQYEKELSLSLEVSVCLIAIVGSIAGTAILIIACLRPKRMCKFPAIFVIYMVLDALVVELLILLSYVDRPGLYCSSKSLLDSLHKVTPYCVITGISFSYITFQVTLWWLFHTSILLWKVIFPFHSQAYLTSGKLKYVHAVCLIIGIFLPVATVISSMSKFGVQSRNEAEKGTSAQDLFIIGGLGYSITMFPPIICAPSDNDILFYSLILPIVIMQAAGSTILIFILWHIHRQNVNKKRNSPNTFQFGTAEKKLLLVFVYFEILVSIVLVTATLQSRYSSEFTQSVFDFFLCEQRGHDWKDPCSRSDIKRLGFASVSILSYIILGLFPVVILVYALNINEIKKFIKDRSKGKILI